VKTENAATALTMASDDLEAVNSFASPQKISPKESRLSLKNNKLQATISSNSFVVYKVKIKK